MAEFRVIRIMQGFCPFCEKWFDLDWEDRFPNHPVKKDDEEVRCASSLKNYMFVGPNKVRE